MERKEKDEAGKKKLLIFLSSFLHFSAAAAVASETDISSSATSADPDRKYLACDRFLPTVSVKRLAGGKNGSSDEPTQSALAGVGGVAAPVAVVVPAAAVVPWCGAAAAAAAADAPAPGGEEGGGARPLDS